MCRNDSGLLVVISIPPGISRDFQNGITIIDGIFSGLIGYMIILAKDAASQNPYAKAAALVLTARALSDHLRLYPAAAK